MPFTGTYSVSKTALLSALPPAWCPDLSDNLRQRIQQANRKLIVFDDDPTGAQALHSAHVLTRWTPDDLIPVLTDSNPLFFMVSNTRSMSRAEAIRTNRDMATAVANAANTCGIDFDILIRGDSTLRGHFPHERNAIQDVLQSHHHTFDGTILCPFFLEGGRFTAFDVQWVAEGDTLIPAGQTAYAQDRTFGYTASNLCDWVAEKTSGQIKASDVLSLSLEVIRCEGPNGVQRILSQATKGRIIIVNAVTYRDLQVVVSGLLDAQDHGQRFFFRTAASFLKIRSGLPDRGLLRHQDFGMTKGCGGLTMVGSYTQKSTDQLQAARELTGVVSIELTVENILNPATSCEEIHRVGAAIHHALQAHQDIIVFTSRNRDRAGNLDVGKQIGQALSTLIRMLSERPQYVIAKGGNTALSIVRDGLNARQSWAMGQILPGVPVWRLGAESRFPDLPIVVFPGNVGQPNSLAKAIEHLRVASRHINASSETPQMAQSPFHRRTI
jgi:uncharacterized protein YgbK (DUF1537 family)